MNISFKPIIKYLPIIIFTSSFCASYYSSGSTVYKFNLEKQIAANNADSNGLFENTEQYFKKNSSGKTKISVNWDTGIENKNIDDLATEYYTDDDLSDPSDNTDYYGKKIDSSTNINIENLDLAQNEKNWHYDIFNDYKEPDIFKTHKQVTKFSKYDRFYGKELCGNGEYTCIKLKKGDNWKKLFPDKYERELIQRLNRTNRGLWNRKWILVPNNINKDYLDYSPMPDYKDTNNEKMVYIDTKLLAFGAYDENGTLVHWGPVNPGKPSSRTARGENFKIYRKGSSKCWSKKYESGIPYCMFFYRGFAMHGYAMPGYAASHGCVRMYNSDAKWLNREFTEYGTRVIVK